MARGRPGCIKIGFGLVLVAVGTLAGGQIFFVGTETMAVGLSALGVRDPVLGWALTGGTLGALSGVLVGLRQAGRQRMFWVKTGAFAAVLLLVLLGVDRAGEIIDREIRAPVLYITGVGVDGLNVRPAPSTRNTPITALARDTRIDVLEERPDWVRIRYLREGRRGTGWVSRRYVNSPSDRVYDVGRVSPQTGRVEGPDADVTPPVLSDGIEAFRRSINVPDVARNGEIYGQVVITAVVDERGRVGDLEVESSPHPVLAGAARAAVREARFRPARRAGRAVRSRITFPVDFGAE